MHIDDLVLRIRRLPSAKRKKLDEIVRSLEESQLGVVPALTGGERPRTLRSGPCVVSCGI